VAAKSTTCSLLIFTSKTAVYVQDVTLAHLPQHADCAIQEQEISDNMPLMLLAARSKHLWLSTMFEEDVQESRACITGGIHRSRECINRLIPMYYLSPRSFSRGRCVLRKLSDNHN
jgi:hypothetical protein